MSNLRAIHLAGGTIHVGAPEPQLAEQPAVLLVAQGWLDGITFALPPARAREIAQALLEFALAAEQAAASLVGHEKPERVQ